MTIVKKETDKNGVVILRVRQDVSDEILEKRLSTKCTKRDYKDLVTYDCDIYDDLTNKMILRFRKNVLTQKHVDDAYENLIDFAKHKTGARGIASGSEIKDIALNNRICSNILGYFDSYTIFHKHMFKVTGTKAPGPVRVTRFTNEYPDKWAKVIPLVKDIDQMYKKLAPVAHKYQLKHAHETAYHIDNTAFSTLTVNLNWQTGIHTDSGNLQESMGNLVVIEKGKYEGGYLCYPGYKIAADVRSTDMLIMSIFYPHGNLPIKLLTPDAQRMSLVSYMREGIWRKSKGSTEEDIKKGQRAMRRILVKYNKIREANKANKSKAI
jgi:hypothetical protein